MIFKNKKNTLYIFFISILLNLLYNIFLNATDDLPTVIEADTTYVFDLFDTEVDTLLQHEVAVWDSLFYQADTLFYYVELETILLKGNAKVTYHTSTIQADMISIDFSKNQSVAIGNVILEDREQIIIGASVYYDIESQTGLVIEGASRFDMGYYYGSEIRKVSDEVYDLDFGCYTSCDALHPHFDIRAWTMRFYQDDVIVGRPVFFYVNNFPVLALPFAAFSVKGGRASGFLMPEPGYTPREGKYLRNLAYYYVINDYSDVTLSMDFIEKHGYNFGTNYIYMDRYRYNGNLNAKYDYRQSQPDEYNSQWYLNYRHFHRLPEKATFNISLEFMSSREVHNTNTDVNDRLKEEVRSSISWRKPLASSDFTASASYTENLTNNNIRMTLPRFSYSLPSRPVHELMPFIPESVRKEDHWWKSFSVSWSALGSHEGVITASNPSIDNIIWKNEKNDSGEYISVHHAGIRQNISLSHNTTLLTWLRLTNSLNYQDAIFDRDRDGNLLVHGYSYGYNNSLSFNLYGVGNYNRGPVASARHIITPRVGFSYSPDFTENRRFYNFDGISVSQSPKTMRMNFDLDNRWQFRLIPDKNLQEKRLNDLFVFRSSTSYNFEADTRPWSDLNHSLTINPGSYSLAGVNFGIDQSFYTTNQVYNDFNFSSYRANTNLQLSGDALYFDYFPLLQNDFVTNNLFAPDSLSTMDEQILTIYDLERLESPGSWSIRSSFDYHYNRASRRKTENLSNNISLKLTQNWSISYNNRYDITNNNMMSQGFEVNRNLHCWNLRLSYSQSNTFWDVRIYLNNTRISSLRLRHGVSS